MSVVNPPGARFYSAPQGSEIELVGSVHQLKFPPLCIRCGQYADTALPLAKLFWYRRRGRPLHYTLDRINVPCCTGCLLEHQQHQRAISAEVRRRLLLGWLGRSLPYFFPLGVILWMLSTLFIPQLLQVLTDADRVWWEALFWGVAGAGFAVLGVMFLLAIIRGGQMMHDAAVRSGDYVNIERGPLFSRMMIPTTQTATLSAFDFSANRADLFDRRRHLYRFSNPTVAAEFAQLNADRIWNPDAPTALLAHYLRMGIFIGLGLLLLVSLFNSWFG